MNTHDIELPPLPEWVDWPVTVSEMSASEIKEAMQAYARAAIEADRKRRKPQHIDPELKAAIEDAAATRSPVATTKYGRGVMLNYGDEEDRMAEHEDNACPYCGGSGHKDDVSERKRRGEPVGITSIVDMCRILKEHYIEEVRRTDCAILYTVTFDQLRAIYDRGRREAPQPAEPVKQETMTARELADRVARGEKWKIAEPVKVPSTIDLIADDAYAATFQSVGQYRKALLASLHGATGDGTKKTK